MIAPETLFQAYASGWFPMAVSPGEIRWYSPDPRGIIPLDTFHVPRRLSRALRGGRFEIRVDTAFRDVIVACSKREDADGNWIDQEIIDSYVNLHALGHAHSVEAWRDGALAGGLYGVAIGGAFFGESMFHRVADASKAALVALVDRLRMGGFTLLDTQWVTDHLLQFGAIEVPRRRYLRLLDAAIKTDAAFTDSSRPGGQEEIKQ
ncbi:MAG TPA: leucyl/phenylalanyl-tRNA--protein transferase [Vicinamibacterales bacterium]|jgi:leucyl/phenylalanyl-tRNA--protein transferase|nr:leucyl/phenylalanyl-tRNA--protein transferase [Vicinamibacterales bacterium]